MQTQAIKLLENNPALWKRMNESKDVTLSQHFQHLAYPLCFWVDTQLIFLGITSSDNINPFSLILGQADRLLSF